MHKKHYVNELGRRWKPSKTCSQQFGNELSVQETILKHFGCAGNNLATNWKTIPEQIDPENSLGANEQIISQVNNKVNNICYKSNNYRNKIFFLKNLLLKNQEYIKI